MLKLCFPEKSSLLEGRVRLRVSTDEQNLDLQLHSLGAAAAVDDATIA
jgi:hypothetical protein